LQEVLRLHTIGISTRLVMKDHMLDNKYLLKAGNTVMIPGPVQHTDVNSWGSNVASFDHRRFLPGNKRHNATAFRGFGGGTTLCPGRHFASTEILAFTALLILRFEVKPVGGEWKELTTEKAAMWETTPVPNEDIEVEISARGEEEGVKWRVLVSDSDKAMPLSAEDE
jgi:cytochrome P450